MINCVILCGGKGTRMGSSDTHKVCFEVEGVAAINRAISNYKEAGIKKFILVVGDKCGQVVETVGKVHPETVFVYQHEPLGTGHAARIGINAVRQLGLDGPILLTMGDKIVEPGVVEDLIESFKTDVSFAVMPKEYAQDAGRVVIEDGKVLAIREVPDIKRAMFYKYLAGMREIAATAEDVREKAYEVFPKEKKRKAALGSLWDAIENGDLGRIYDYDETLQYIKIKDRLFDPAEIEERAEYVNASVYLFKQDAIFYALDRLESDNAQGEQYLTDVIEIIGNAVPVVVTDRYGIMSFNNPDELLVIRDYYRKKKEKSFDSSSYKPVGEWLKLFSVIPQAFYEYLESVYGDDEDFILERCKTIADTLRLFMGQYGEDKRVVITRAPGRVNIMGRHIDHRGGNVNVMSINKEVVIVASPRDDDTINLVNLNDSFKECSFTISEHLVDIPWDSWLGYLNCDKVKQLVAANQGSWVNYVKAACLRLQHRNPHMRLNGMDMAVSGNIPIAAGLSSSSAMVVATAETVIALNGLDVSPSQFVDLCGEGEWFVGSRGGSADHAAMKFAGKDEVITMSFHPFEVVKKTTFPKGCKLVIANSRLKAEKSRKAKDQFNHRVACYEFGMMLLKEKYSYRMEHLRDISPETLGVPLSTIYQMIMYLPQEITVDELYKRLPESYHSRIKESLSTHGPAESYPIRSVVLYGISECARAKKCSALLEKGDLEALGELMNISHDGDRVVRYVDGEVKSHPWHVSDEYLLSLISDLKSEDLSRVRRAQLERQYGGYACSTPVIDNMVDIANRVPGVYGSQLSGAGLGGCIMVLVKDTYVDRLIDALESEYYAKRGLEPDITICSPVKGSGVLKFKQ